MIVSTRVIDEKHSGLTVDFSDENVLLVGESVVVGSEADALSYAKFFGADLRRINADLFPMPEMPDEMEGELE
jgi:hypothetical protein